MTIRPVYKRVLLKLSGEALAGGSSSVFDISVMDRIASEIKEIHDSGVEIGIVIGGGNIFRGATADGIQRAEGDTIGMLATAINSLVMREHLEKLDVDARVLSAIDIPKAAEFFTRGAALAHLAKKRVVIIAGGTGNPFFTTDTAAALRCLEIGAEVFLKATKVDGIYSADPKKDATAKLYNTITYEEVLRQKLRVMDLTAITMLMEHKVPLVVFNLKRDGNIMRVVKGERVGTEIRP
jgi:uridylate kinase